MPVIFVDADACPVKQETYRVADRYNLEIRLVANAAMRIPDDSRITLEIVANSPDAADDLIASCVRPDDIVITGDIPLASRCLKAGAHVIGPTGRRFTDDNIGSALALRNLLADLRSAGEMTGGPPALTNRDRSRFLEQLDEVIQMIRRRPVPSSE